MDNSDKFAAFAIILLSAAFVCICYFVVAAQCTSQWSQKYRPEFGLITQCTIEVKGDRIPAKNYRVM